MAAIIKGERRGRPGRWIVDFRDASGRRRWRVCRTREQAEQVLAAVLRQARRPGRPAGHPDTTLAEYAPRYLEQLVVTAKPRTLDSARGLLERHVLPALGPLTLRALDRPRLKRLLADKLRAGYSRDTVRLILAVVRALLNAALEDGLVEANPAARLGRQLRLMASPAARQDAIKAMDRTQLRAFLEACRTHPSAEVRRHYPLFLVMARTGVRLGEALGLRWQDVDWRGRALRVERGLSGTGRHRRLETPKSGHGRTVDLSQQTLSVLRRLEVKRKAETLRRGWGEVPPWLFVNTAGQPLDASRVRKVFRACSGPPACRATGAPTACATPSRACSCRPASPRPTSSASSATRASS